MLQNQKEITARVLNSLNLFTLSQEDYYENPYVKKLIRKYSGAIRRDIRSSLKKNNPTFLPTLDTNEALDIFSNDVNTFEYRLDKLIHQLTIRGMNAYGVCGKGNIGDYVANIEFTLVKSLIGECFEKEKVWIKAIDFQKPNKISFAINRFGIKLSFND